MTVIEASAKFSKAKLDNLHKKIEAARKAYQDRTRDFQSMQDVAHLEERAAYEDLRVYHYYKCGCLEYLW